CLVPGGRRWRLHAAPRPIGDRPAEDLDRRDDEVVEAVTDHEAGRIERRVDDLRERGERGWGREDWRRRVVGARRQRQLHVRGWRGGRRRIRRGWLGLARGYGRRPY